MIIAPLGVMPRVTETIMQVMGMFLSLQVNLTQGESVQKANHPFLLTVLTDR